MTGAQLLCFWLVYRQNRLPKPVKAPSERLSSRLDSFWHGKHGTIRGVTQSEQIKIVEGEYDYVSRTNLAVSTAALQLGR